MCYDLNYAFEEKLFYKNIRKWPERELIIYGAICIRFYLYSEQGKNSHVGVCITVRLHRVYTYICLTSDKNADETVLKDIRTLSL